MKINYTFIKSSEPVIFLPINMPNGTIVTIKGKCKITKPVLFMKRINITPILLLIALCGAMKLTAKAQAQSYATTSSAANAITVASSLVTVTNSATETTLYSKLITGGLLGNSRSIHINIYAQLSSTLVNPTLTIKIKYGTAVLTAVSALSINASLTSVPFFIEADITNTNSTGAQYAFSRMMQNTVTAPLALSSAVYIASGTWAIDSTVDQTLAVTATFNSALTGTTLIPILITSKIE